jgi:hypothetical protein
MPSGIKGCRRILIIDHQAYTVKELKGVQKALRKIDERIELLINPDKLLVIAPVKYSFVYLHNLFGELYAGL